MKLPRHVKVYLDYFHIAYNETGPAEPILCENCKHKRGVDIHHINGRGEGKDVIENLMALCRDCHTQAHNGGISKTDLKLIHWYKLHGN